MLALTWVLSPVAVPSAAWIMLLPSDVARLVLGKSGRGDRGPAKRDGRTFGAKGFPRVGKLWALASPPTTSAW